jgi:hypothetical protein
MQSRHRGRRFLREDVQRSMWQDPRNTCFIATACLFAIRGGRGAAACKAAGLVKPKLGKSGESVTEIISDSNGGRGIRTPGTVPRTAVFKTAGFNRSPIPPMSSLLLESREFQAVNQHHTLSTPRAIPIPPLIHNVASPYRLFFLCISYSSVVTMRDPVQPIG